MYKQKNNNKKKKGYHVYSVVKYFSNFQYINSTKEINLISFKREILIQEKNDLDDLAFIGDSDLILNDDFNQINYLHYINKKCSKRNRRKICEK